MSEPVPTQTAEEEQRKKFFLHLRCLELAGALGAQDPPTFLRCTYEDLLGFWVELLKSVREHPGLVRTQAIAEAADAIQSIQYYVYPPPEGEDRARLDGLRTARDAAAELVRDLADPKEKE